MIYVCKPITREYCQIAGNLAVRMNMNEHTAWLVTLASAALAFATLLIATLLLTTCDRDSFNCNGKSPRPLQPSSLQPWALQPWPLYPQPFATLPVATLRLETLAPCSPGPCKPALGGRFSTGVCILHPTKRILVRGAHYQTIPYGTGGGAGEPGA